LKKPAYFDLFLKYLDYPEEAPDELGLPRGSPFSPKSLTTKAFGDP